MRISDWSSDVCSSDLDRSADGEPERTRPLKPQRSAGSSQSSNARLAVPGALTGSAFVTTKRAYFQSRTRAGGGFGAMLIGLSALATRSEEHTSELQSPMSISYAVFRLKNKTVNTYYT